MAHAFAADGEDLVAIMDDNERAVVAGLCLQVMDLDDPAVFALSVYDFLTWLQESLTQALVGEAPE